MENHFETGIEKLRQQLLVMASHYDLALRVKADDDVIDRCEVVIDDLAIQLLTKAPLATNLRLVTVAMKISQDLERIGDEASKIAKRARDLSQEPPVKIQLDLPRMAGRALEMLKAALDAFVHHDPAAARAVILRDKEVDDFNKQIHAALVQHMVENPDTISRCLHWMVAAKSLERIADHATNIAEDVVYLCEAQDIRHTGFKNQAAPAAA
jgi:phosphate transport system protein